MKSSYLVLVSPRVGLCIGVLANTGIRSLSIGTPHVKLKECYCMIFDLWSRFTCMKVSYSMGIPVQRYYLVVDVWCLVRIGQTIGLDTKVSFICLSVKVYYILV